MDWDKIFTKIKTYEEEAISLQQQLISIPALSPVNGGDGEEEKAKLVKKFLNSLGKLEITEVNAPDKRVSCGFRPNIIAKLPGRDAQRTVWIMSHLDIVPPGEGKLWNTNPYQAVVKDGKIYGRGAEDNHQGLVASLLALKAFFDTGITPYYSFGVVIVADEETGSEYGLKYVLENFEGFSPADLIVVPDAGNPEGSLIEVAEKSIMWTKFITTGKQCHASTPHKGINAFKAASHLVTKLEKLYELFPASDPLFSPPISTFEPTKKEANVPNINTLPGEDIFYLDSRVLPIYPLEEVLKAIEKMIKEVEEKFKVTIKIDFAQKNQAAPPTSIDAPIVKSLTKAIREVYNVEPTPKGIGGGTVAAFFRRKGYPVAVWSTLDEMAHQPNEYCIIENLLKDASVFAWIALNKI